MTTRGVVLGLDGAAWHLLEPIIREGAMPRLEQLRTVGASGTLVSTIPPYTAPAWTSAFTGVNPGRHGVFGFFSGNVQRSPELMHLGMVKAPTLWNVANLQGASVGVFNVPMTYPPRPLEGWMVSGMMTPHRRTTGGGFAWPKSVEEGILSLVPDYLPDLYADVAVDWRDDALCRKALAVLDQRRRVLEHLLETRPTDLVFSVIEVPDRLQHVYYRYLDPADALYESAPGRQIRGLLIQCFQAMDKIIGLAHDYVGRDGALIVCSDHGFTGWDMTVRLNALLKEWGYLKFNRSSALYRSRAATSVLSRVRRLLPHSLTARVKQQRAKSAVDWSRTRAFASPKTYQMLFVNAKDRESLGVVEPQAVEGVKDELARRFAALRTPLGDKVDAVVWKSQDAFHGDALMGAPDIVPILNDNRYYLDTGLFTNTPFEDSRHLPRGVHHMDGIGLFVGPGVQPGTSFDGSIMDVMPSLLYLAGLAVPEGLDGCVPGNALIPGHLLAHPIRTMDWAAPMQEEQLSPYTEDEEAEIEERLRSLGYL